MKGVLNSVKMQMLWRGDNVPNAGPSQAKWA